MMTLNLMKQLLIFSKSSALLHIVHLRKNMYDAVMFTEKYYAIGLCLCFTKFDLQYYVLPQNKSVIPQSIYEITNVLVPVIPCTIQVEEQKSSDTVYTSTTEILAENVCSLDGDSSRNLMLLLL